MSATSRVMGHSSTRLGCPTRPRRTQTHVQHMCNTCATHVQHMCLLKALLPLHLEDAAAEELLQSWRGTVPKNGCPRVAGKLLGNRVLEALVVLQHLQQHGLPMPTLGLAHSALAASTYSPTHLLSPKVLSTTKPRTLKYYQPRPKSTPKYWHNCAKYCAEMHRPQTAKKCTIQRRTHTHTQKV